ncbi:Two-component response regulator 24 [Sesamum angolense]|uniref:Two-component response regulator 24 n=1 Tax=Sesamum angolense TaxID=2727404 RepID=A0AAE1WTW3_9LAMI|nr:Two-component response regulator 24 [Sesamum angolense]
MVPWFYLAGKMVIGSSKKVVAEQIEEVRRICALVVDDDPLVRRIHGMLLARYGLEIEAAENGQEAVDLFLSGKTFDLVLMDMEMPIMDGLQHDSRGNCSGLEAEKEAFMATGLDACWVKPLNAEAVISVLDELAKKLL